MTQTRRVRKTREERETMQQEALQRAVAGQTMSNWAPIIKGFVALGIAEADVQPRVNVFTYHAWRALGRQVRRGAHGVKVLTFVSVKGKEDRDGIGSNDADGTDQPRPGSWRRPWTATVFHVSQTDPIQK